MVFIDNAFGMNRRCCQDCGKHEARDHGEGFAETTVKGYHDVRPVQLLGKRRIMPAMIIA